MWIAKLGCFAMVPWKTPRIVKSVTSAKLRYKEAPNVCHATEVDTLTSRERPAKIAPLESTAATMSRPHVSCANKASSPWWGSPVALCAIWASTVQVLVRVCDAHPARFKTPRVSRRVKNVRSILICRKRVNLPKPTAFNATTIAPRGHLSATLLHPPVCARELTFTQMPKESAFSARQVPIARPKTG